MWLSCKQRKEFESKMTIVETFETFETLSKRFRNQRMTDDSNKCSLTYSWFSCALLCLLCLETLEGAFAFDEAKTIKFTTFLSNLSCAFQWFVQIRWPINFESQKSGFRNFEISKVSRFRFQIPISVLIAILERFLVALRKKEWMQ